jgi:hypothetical protein
MQTHQAAFVLTELAVTHKLFEDFCSPQGFEFERYGPAGRTFILQAATRPVGRTLIRKAGGFVTEGRGFIHEAGIYPVGRTFIRKAGDLSTRPGFIR